ncbi:hypothetical protein [Sphingobacterium griseoflavum]|uniref:PEGA domain-containing protein n=1 Tax=Sphingobacterium griseoflavum TaxID=1474952 RepID=A0ABQ3HQ33_9SPHI|nr:hypothetical protein [Sphingobacterium griseoflavum]GHE23380.1 hypothetical protein GCM10017764_03480 [Sphingobacterium griseoflavum]
MRFYRQSLFYFVVGSLLLYACAKGEHIDNYVPFTQLVVENAAGLQLYVDNEPYVATGGRAYRVQAGRRTLGIYKGSEKIVEGVFDIAEGRDTLTLLNLSDDIPPALVREEPLPYEEGFINVRMVNTNKEIADLLDDEPFHLVFYQQQDFRVRPPQAITFHEIGDTIRQVTSTIPNGYQRIDVSDNQQSIWGFTGRAQVLKADYTPLIYNGLEVFVSYAQGTIDMSRYHAFTLYITNDVLGTTTSYSNTGPYWNFPDGFAVAVQN